MKENRILISKLDSARRQLETAIKLFFANGDFVSIHALSYAAYTITRSLCDQTRNPESFTKWMHDNVSKSQHDELTRCVSEAGNFFKHADRDPKVILEYIPDQYEIFLIFAVKQYEAITHEVTQPMSVFKVWYLLHHPESIAKDDIKKQPSESELKRLSEMDKGEFYERISKALLLAQRKILQ
jgi:hypothetical protein